MANPPLSQAEYRAMVARNHKVCRLCLRERPPSGHDPCLQDLPRTRYACCGHGLTSGYVVIEVPSHGRRVPWLKMRWDRANTLPPFPRARVVAGIEALWAGQELPEGFIGMPNPPLDAFDNSTPRNYQAPCWIMVAGYSVLP